MTAKKSGVLISVLLAAALSLTACETTDNDNGDVDDDFQTTTTLGGTDMTTTTLGGGLTTTTLGDGTTTEP